MALLKGKIDRRSTVFVDTSALVALLVISDSLHLEARLRMSEFREKRVRIVTTDLVFYELANGLSSVRYRGKAIELVEELRQMENLDVVWSSFDLFEKALQMYKERLDKAWSLTDCASFVVMKERDVSLAFTSDRHFEQAGFIKLLEN